MNNKSNVITLRSGLVPGPVGDAYRKTKHIADASDAYNVANWSDGFFSINEKGQVSVHIGPSKAIPLVELILQQGVQGVSLPVIVRFYHIIHQRIYALYDAFHAAIRTKQYAADYTLLYPIKVNQRRRVVEEVIHAQTTKNLRAGLEVGTKAELMIALALAPIGSLIVCNGYKDVDYIELALMGKQLGFEVMLVIEKPLEASMIAKVIKENGIVPSLGVRVQLASQAQGAWAQSSGDKAKFGLNATGLLDVMHTLTQTELLSNLKMLHVHIGSQLVDINDIRSALHESCLFYAELRALGAPVSMLDLGGGLAVDYEGTKSTSHCSMNYSMCEYAELIVQTVGEFCLKRKIKAPNLLTESGRAVVAHHSVLLANLIDVESDIQGALRSPKPDAPDFIQALWRLYKDSPLISDVGSVSQVLNLIADLMAECESAYKGEQISLTERAYAEEVARAICHMVYQGFQSPANDDHEMIAHLHQKLAKQSHINFSVFSSLPDAWGLDQVFPVMPISGLDEPLNSRIVVSDITCDSQGSLGQYIADGVMRNTLSIPAWKDGAPKVLAFFLVGAYQETLGSKHNLLGRTRGIDVTVDSKGKLDVVSDKSGECIADVLHAVDYSHDQMMARLQDKLDSLSLPEIQQAELTSHFQQGLYGATYLQGL